MFALLFATGVLKAQSGRSRTVRTTGDTTTTTSDHGTPANSLPAAARKEDRTLGDEAGPQTDIQPETVEGDVVRIDTTLVTVPVSVRDRDGRYIPDLREKDFRIFEEGVEQQIAYFATLDQPFTVALVLDTSGSTDIRLNDIQEAAIAFVGQLKSEDRVLIVSFDERIDVLAEPTNDRQVLTKAIRRTRSGGSTRLYDAVDFVIKQRLRQIAGRKAIVLFTDGIDTASRRASYESTMRQAEELDALIYPVSYSTFGGGLRGIGPPTFPLPGRRGGVIIGSPFPRGGGGPSRAQIARGEAYLNGLAQVTGGRFYRGDSVMNIAQAFAWVAEELRRQYSLGYYPKPPGQAGQRRQLKVRVTQPNLVVLARDSYIYSQKKTDTAPPNGQQFSKSASQTNNLSEAF